MGLGHSPSKDARLNNNLRKFGPISEEDSKCIKKNLKVCPLISILLLRFHSMVGSLYSVDTEEEAISNSENKGYISDSMDEGLDRFCVSKKLIKLGSKNGECLGIFKLHKA